MLKYTTMYINWGKVLVNKWCIGRANRELSLGFFVLLKSKKFL